MQIYRKPTTEELNGPQYDQPETEPVVKFLICSTPCAGSRLLCRQLLNVGMGVPHDYYDPQHTLRLCQRWGLAHVQDESYRRELYARRTTPNGAWGALLHSPQPANGIDRFIYFHRADDTAQAVSLHLALAGDPSAHVAVADMANVEGCLQTLQRRVQDWRDYFATHDLQPLIVTYEEMLADPSTALLRISDYLELPLERQQLPEAEERTEPYAPHLADMREILKQRFDEFRELSRPLQACAS